MHMCSSSNPDSPHIRPDLRSELEIQISMEEDVIKILGALLDDIITTGDYSRVCQVKCLINEVSRV